MKHSDSIKNLSAALKEFSVSTVAKNADNPFFKSKYATLDSIIEHSKDALRSLGISVIQGASYNPEGLIIETRLVHESGEWIETETFVPIEKNTPQGAGSAITYGRRYALGAILNIGTDEDDDGNHAIQKPVVTINFDRLNDDLNKLKTPQEVKDYMIKYKANAGGWTKEQIADVNRIGMEHLKRAESVTQKVENTFDGEQQ